MRGMGDCAEKPQEFPACLGWVSERYNLQQEMCLLAGNSCLEGLGWMQVAGLAAGSVFVVEAVGCQVRGQEGQYLGVYKSASSSTTVSFYNLIPKNFGLWPTQKVATHRLG